MQRRRREARETAGDERRARVDPGVRAGAHPQHEDRHRESNRRERNREVLATGEMLYEEMGATPMGWLKRGIDETSIRIRARLDESEVAAATERGRSLSADEAVALALASLR